MDEQEKKAVEEGMNKFLSDYKEWAKGRGFDFAPELSVTARGVIPTITIVKLEEKK